MDTLPELFRYHTWATLTLIDHCAGLPAETLRESTPGTAGPILETLVHLVAAEQRYLSRLPVEQPNMTVREGMEPSLADLRAVVEEQATRWATLLERWAELDVTMPQLPDGWPETPHAETLLALQTLHHGNDHRTHIGTTLGAHGRAAPDSAVGSTGRRGTTSALLRHRRSPTARPEPLVQATRRAHRLDEHLGHLRPAELRRRDAARGEHLAHLRAGERDVLLRRVRAGLGRGHPVAALAVEGVVEEERRDRPARRVELVEDVLRVVGAVVVADAGVVAADDEVRAAVVLAHQRVEDRLARAGVAHRRREARRAARGPPGSSSSSSTS